MGDHGGQIARRAVLGLMAGGASACATAAAQTAPPAHPIAPPRAEEQRPRAIVVAAPYRYDDILWENDRTAHRIYGRALEAHEPPSGSGIDAWGKRVRWPFMERQLHTSDQHADNGEGLDCYNVGGTRGVGGLGVWFDNKLWTSRNYRAARFINDDPAVACFEVDYAPWPVDVVRTVRETRRFTLAMGTNFTRLTSSISSDRPEPLVIGIGLTKRSNDYGAGALTADRARGAFSVWTAPVPEHGSMGTAVLVDPAMIADVKEDADSHLVLVNVTPDRPFSYRIGACWDGGLDFHTRAEWDAYVRAQAEG